MTSGPRLVTANDLDDALEHFLAPKLNGVLATHGPGHCMRVDDVETGLAGKLSRRLRSAGTAQVWVLGGPPEVDEDVAASSTKIVELRNPDDTGGLRPPLLVFVPPGARASAEDSFGVATFEQIGLGSVYRDLRNHLLGELPATLRTNVRELYEHLEAEKWPHSAPTDQIRHLLAIRLNGTDPESVGGSLCELGLIPDPHLLDNPVAPRALANLGVVRQLTEAVLPERQRVLGLQLTEPAFRKRFAEFAVETGLSNPRDWTKRITAEARARKAFAFGNWPLPDQRTYAEVDIEVGPLPLPRAGENDDDVEHEVLREIDGQPYLSVNAAQGTGKKDISVEFTAHREARMIDGLKRFRVQIVAEGEEDPGLIGQPGIPTEVATTVAAKRTAQKTYKAKLTKLLAAQWEEGWHFVRVTALDADGVTFPHVRREESAAVNQAEHPSYESERFYVLVENPVEVPTDKRKRRAPGATHAARRLEFDAISEGRSASAIQLRGTRWGVTAKNSGDPRDSLLADFGTDGLAEIALSPPLTDIQRRILAAPRTAGHWHLSAAVGAENAGLDQPTHSGAEWTQWVDEDLRGAFFEAREAVFAGIAELTADPGDQTAADQTTASTALPVEGADLLALREEVTAYAQAYQDLLEDIDQRAASASGNDLALVWALAHVARIDCVTVDVADHRGAAQGAVIIAPTHPLRLLWITAWAHLGGDWARRLNDGRRDDAMLTRETLFGSVTPLGFPLVVPELDGRLNLAAFDLTPYWGVCLPSGSEDPQGVCALLQNVLKAPEQVVLSDSWSARTLELRLEQYVRQHPYVETLVVNAFNVGRGEELADAIAKLHQRDALKHIAYEVRLFVGDPEAPGIGEALVERLLHTDDVGPKVGVSVRDRAAFAAEGDGVEEQAHITLLFDALSAEDIHTAPARPDCEDGGVLPVHGLVQDMVVDYRDDHAGTIWRKRPRLGRALPIPGAEELSDLLATLPHAVATSAGRVATGGQGARQVPEVALVLDVADSTLLDRAHRCSDWVLTVDRTLGVEFFDNPLNGRRPEHVIDYAPDTDTGLGHRVVVSSRALDELRALLAPMTGQHGLNVADRHVHTFFDQLRLLSGRLAFKIASTAATQRMEVLGLALGRLYLDYQGALRDQILVPLDAHQDLYSEARMRKDGVGATVDLRRTDLALFDIDAGRQTITCRLVEVKCGEAGQGLAEHRALRDRIRDQIEASHQMLTAHFAAGASRRPDRAVKNLRLSNLLRYYLDRGVRHGNIGEEAAANAHWLLLRLDDGFSLEFTRTGLVFDLGSDGSERETANGIEYHRIGRDLVQELLDKIPTEPFRDDATSTEEAAAVDTVRDLDLSMPRFDSAAFLANAAKAAIPEYVPRSDDTFVESGADADGDDAPSSLPEAAAAAEDESEPGAVAPAAPASEYAGGETGRTPVAPPGPANRTRPSTVADAASAPAAPTEAPGEPGIPEKTASSADPTAMAFPCGRDGADPGPPRRAELTVRHGAGPDIMLGSTEEPVQYGVIGEVHGRRVAIDFNETHTVSLFGQQGAGKSYTLGSLIEAATLPAPPASVLPNPLATIVFHYSKTMDYAPEFTSMTSANAEPAAQAKLAEDFDVQPDSFSDVVLLAPEDQVAARAAEYPGIDVRPLKFSSAELRAEHWKFLMGAVGNKSVYIRQLMRILKQHRDDLRLDVIREAVENSKLADRIRELAEERLAFAADYIDDSARVSDLVRPGRLIIVDLRDEYVEEDQALGLFVVLMQVFAEAQNAEHRFNKLVVFDEAHKYIQSPELVKGLVENVREMRHKGMSILVASQDPPSVPAQLIELSDHIIVHKFTSPQWLKHLQNAKTALRSITSEKLSSLSPGEAYVWAEKATDDAFSTGMARVRMRPRITQHGGGTQTAADQ